ncbi:MAG TPA: hypothetical protein HPP83_07615 [Candidatus Hydrogenedentes bacterium]|nr:hypothetical protein [Candidatus Hydrogenedentota bacterium]
MSQALYTVGMIALALCALVIVADDGALPCAASTRGRTVWIVRVKGEEEPLYGFLSNDAVWEKEYGTVILELDMPHTQEEFKSFQRQDVIEHNKERLGREKRIKEGLEKAGLVCKNGVVVAKEEVALADRAREMAGVVRPADEMAEEPTDTDTVQSESAPSDLPRPGLFSLWGPHALIAVFAIGLLAVIGKVFFNAA